MKRWIGLILALILAACQDTTQWLEAVEEPALTFKEQRFDTLALRLQEQMPPWQWADLPFAPARVDDLNQDRIFLTSGPTWKGITLPNEARLVMADRIARGEHVLFHVPATARAATADLQRQLASEGWQLLEVMTRASHSDPYAEYLSFWRSQLSFLPQHMFVTACVLVQDETAGLAILELSTRCTELRQAALALGVEIPDSAQTADGNVVDMGAWLTHVPYAWQGYTPYVRTPLCAAPASFVCLHQQSLEADDSIITLRLLTVHADILPLALHPARVLDIAQSLSPGSLPLLLQPVVLKNGVPGIQLYSLLVDAGATSHAVRTEVHFFQDQRYLVFEGMLSGPIALHFHQVPMLSQVLQQVESGITE